MKRQRKNVNALCPAELDRYRAAILRLKNMPDGTASTPQSYNDFTTFHFRNCGKIHGTRLFLPWHRALVDQFENALRSDASTADVTVPYWSWFDQDPTADLPHAFIDGNDVTNPLNVNAVLRYCPDQRTQSSVISGFFWGLSRWTATLNQISSWDDFGGVGLKTQMGTGKLEQAHNNMHAWVGQGMAFVASSPKDPIFWSHHSFVDYLWWTNSNFQPSGNQLNDRLPGMGGLTTGAVVNNSDLDYEYVVSSDKLPVESVGSEGALVLEMRRNLPPVKYRVARLTLSVRHHPSELSSMRICWGQDLEQAKSGRLPDGKDEFDTMMATSLHGGAPMPGMEMHMGGFNQTAWLSPAEVDGLTSRNRAVVPITILTFDLTRRRLQGHVEAAAELAFLP